jgi:hypothetical protein
MGVAGMVCHRQAKAMHVELGVEEEIVDGVAVRRPGGWTLRRDEEGLLLEESSPGGRVGGRFQFGMRGRRCFVRRWSFW